MKHHYLPTGESRECERTSLRKGERARLRRMGDIDYRRKNERD
jgi:hypothetical protein